MSPEMGRVSSQSSNAASQSTNMAVPSRPGTAEPTQSRPEATAPRGGHRPQSRGSTASLHSANTQHTQDQHIQDGFSQFDSTQAGHSTFGSNPEEMIICFGHQLSHPTNGALFDPAMQESSHPGISRADDFSSHALHSHNISHQSLTPELPHGLTNAHMPQYQPMYDSSLENHALDHYQDDNEASEAGSKRKKGSSSSLANDNELRKLLREYDGYNIKQMAAEVLKNEGTGGKGEKVKQVFAMIWLRENCRRCSGSVRRDRVYCCYAEKCGTERVSVLNPASFGKLVRIIFPNVQTRRLGVRGESKYHYVDLTVIEEKQQSTPALNPQPHPRVLSGSGIELSEIRAGEATLKECAQGSLRSMDKQSKGHSRYNVDPQQGPADTAVFPSPVTSFAPRFSTNSVNPTCSCQQPIRRQSDSYVTLANVASQSGRLIHQMLQFPPADCPVSDNETFQLPDINDYLPANSDSKVGEALTAIYRSHCISVIDSFRYCKEKNLLRYFSTFHGTLTVPVQKLLAHPYVAPWIKECDWLMYQRMIAFVAPLTTQVVPQLVLDAFNSISQRLAGHIADTFKGQPPHVFLARLLPAHIFCNLLKRMLDVNQAANAAAAWLCHPDNRQQMWNDYKTLVDPIEMMARANIPSCVERATRQVLKNDIRALLTPLDDMSTSTAQRFFKELDTEEDIQAHRYPVQPSTGEDYNFPDKWVAFILSLPEIFPHHGMQCIMEKVDSLWDCILHRLTLGGAQSFSAWWMTKVFFHEMMAWQAEKGGFMRHIPSTAYDSLQRRESANTGACIPTQPSFPAVGKDQLLATSGARQPCDPKPQLTSNPTVAECSPRDRTLETGAQSSSLRNENENQSIAGFHAPSNDDSAIDLDDDSVLVSVGKYGDMMASDPADAEGDVIVI